ncbi:MAG: regulatory protein RecX, partial [Mycobacteriaceae bacterium]
GKGRRALAAELRLKGVEESVAVAALAQVDDASEEQRARELVHKRVRTMVVSEADGKPAVATIRKLAGMLARRGYSQEMAFRVVREELAALGADVEEHLPADQ